jgi:hypothetical protein
MPGTRKGADILTPQLLTPDSFFHVCEVDFMVKLLRACVWMPRRKKAKKDAISCEKLRGAANRL